MKNYKRYVAITGAIVLVLLSFSSCESFLDPDQGTNLAEENLFDDWYEYRASEMGLYGLQADLVEQIVVLGELRGDLLEITPNADVDLVEIYNFNISKGNKYASPAKFFKLIAACNNFLKVLEENHPEVTDPNGMVTNFDKLYGEALCMRAWAYFNAVRIYGKVPFIHESLTTKDEIDNYLNSESTYIDSVHIVFGLDGYENDTIVNEPIELEKRFFDQKLVIDYFTNELETRVKDVGVNHAIYNNDNSWEVTIWNSFAMHSLLGSMYLTDGNLAAAANHFEEIVYYQSDNYRYQIDNTFSDFKWMNIYTGISTQEHIYTLWFDKSFLQQNKFQELFETRSPHKYMLKPTKKAVLLWETIFDDFRLDRDDSRPSTTKLTERGIPGDFYRGHGVSYAYVKDGNPINNNVVREVLDLKTEGDFRTANVTLGDIDTVVWKYSFYKNTYAQDANFIVYRAAGVHLWLAEVYVYWSFDQAGVVKPFTQNAVRILNDGTQYGQSSSREQEGVRGRVGFGGTTDGARVGNINYIHDPYNNKVIGYRDFSGNFLGLQYYLEELILEERARELAFEGERFYDLMRVAKKRNDPSFLASRVSKKFPSGRQEEIYNYLLNEENWYISYFE